MDVAFVDQPGQVLGRAVGGVGRKAHGPAVDVVQVGVAAAGEGAQQVEARQAYLQATAAVVEGM